MMKQIYFTSSKQGVGLENISGQQFRAASQGLTRERLRFFRKIPDYELPMGMSDQVAPMKAPIRLALLPSSVGEGEWVLAHVAYAGLDPASGRPGNFFAHLLIDLPPAWTVRQAIQTWGSPWWMTNDPGGGRLLADVEAFPTGPLNDQQLITYARSERGSNYLAFLAHAVLDRADNQRVFLVSEPAEAALLIYGLTRLIPDELFKDFSFSTYERYPETAQTILTATCWFDLAANDLPPRCYEGIGLALHTSSGRRSALTRYHPFIATGLIALKAGNLSQLDSFHDVCHIMHIDSLEMVDSLFARFFAEPRPALNASDFAELTEMPQLLLRLCEEPDAQKRLLVLADEQPGFLASTFPQVIRTCRQQPAVLARLFTQACEQSYRAFEQNNVERGVRILKALLPTIDLTEAASVQKNLLDRMAQRLSPRLPVEALALETRVALVQITVSQAALLLETLPIVLHLQWIRFSADEGIRWLQPDLARPVRLYVAKEALRRQAIPVSSIARALADDPTCTLSIYLALLNEEDTDAAVRWLNGAAATPESLLEILQRLSISKHARHSIRVAWPVIYQVLNQIQERNLRSKNSHSLVTWLLEHDNLLLPELVNLAQACLNVENTSVWQQMLDRLFRQK